MAEACRKPRGYDTSLLSIVADLLISLSQQESADVRFVATLAAQKVRLGGKSRCGALTL